MITKMEQAYVDWKKNFIVHQTGIREFQVYKRDGGLIWIFECDLKGLDTKMREKFDLYRGRIPK